LLSSYLYPDISDYVDKKDVYYCPYGTPLTIENPVSKRNNNTVCKFLYLSNMMRQKGVFVLLDALKVLKDKQPEFECHFIGGWADITEEEFKEKINSLGLNKQVIVHGPKYGDEKFPFMEETNVFVFPTFYHYECLPFVLLESMEFGLPVISTPEGAIRDIIEDGHTGYIVPQKNVEKLAARMEVLINDPELRKKMGEAGRKRYERLFTLDKFEKRLTDILIEASGNSPKQ
jgi:glycosyltransferase involved in cell wall biosynthesis